MIFNIVSLLAYVTSVFVKACINMDSPWIERDP